MTRAPRTRRGRPERASAPTGITEIDRLDGLAPCTISDYVIAVSAYVREQSRLPSGPKKGSQIRLSNALARALAHELEAQVPHLRGRLVTEERKVAGGLRTTNADVSQNHELDGLRLAVELKPVNLAVGRAIWNRFGDIRTFAVNIHLKFPFAIVGGVLVIPTYEEVGTKAARQAEGEEIAREDESTELSSDSVEAPVEADRPGRKSTLHLITRAVDRLVRAGGRQSEAEAAHLLEGIAVIVYDPDTAAVDASIPPQGSGLRWEEFIRDLATAYRARFED